MSPGHRQSQAGAVGFGREQGFENPLPIFGADPAAAVGDGDRHLGPLVLDVDMNFPVPIHGGQGIEQNVLKGVPQFAGFGPYCRNILVNVPYHPDTAQGQFLFQPGNHGLDQIDRLHIRNHGLPGSQILEKLLEAFAPGNGRFADLLEIFGNRGGGLAGQVVFQPFGGHRDAGQTVGDLFQKTDSQLHGRCHIAAALHLGIQMLDALPFGFQALDQAVGGEQDQGANHNPPENQAPDGEIAHLQRRGEHLFRFIVSAQHPGDRGEPGGQLDIVRLFLKVDPIESLLRPKARSDHQGAVRLQAGLIIAFLVDQKDIRCREGFPAGLQLPLKVAAVQAGADDQKRRTLFPAPRQC